MSKADDPIDVGEQRIIDDAPSASLADQEQQQAVSDFNKDAKGQLSMKARVYSPFNDYYDGQAFSLTAVSATGAFDILPRHHNFMSLLEPCELVIRTVAQGDKRIRISGGLIHVKADQVVIFLDV